MQWKKQPQTVECTACTVWAAATNSKLAGKLIVQEMAHISVLRHVLAACRGVHYKLYIYMT